MKLKFEYFFEKANNVGSFKIMAFLKQIFSRDTLHRTNPEISCPLRLFHERDGEKFTQEVEQRVGLLVGYADSKFESLRRVHMHLYGDYELYRVHRRFDL